MESDTREPRRPEAGQGRALTGEKSPAGSVRRARQRAAAGLPPQQPQVPQYPTPLSIMSPKRSPQQEVSPTDRVRYPQYPSPGPHSPTNAPLGAPRPTPDFSHPRLPSGGESQNVGRGPAPQRPPRPNAVPAMSHSPQSEQSPRNYWDDGSLGSSGSSRPLTTSTISTASSTGSIPDFPSIPSMPPPPLFQPPPRRNLGPPPSARKGGSGYYSNTSFVPPIPEEMSDAHSSIASSHVVQESWGDGPPQYYMGGGIDEEDEEDGQGGNSGRGSSAGDHDDASGLVRKGSYGKPRTTTDGGDDPGPGSRIRELEWQAQEDERWRTGQPGTDPIGRHNFRGDGRLNAQLLYSGYESDLSFLDSPRTQSRTQSPMPNLDAPSPGLNQYFGTPSSVGSPVDPRIGEIIGHLEKGGALASSGTASPSATSTSEKGFKRPPRLNLEDPKQGPGRGSATSLPELIRRATKLASNLDRGKTASQVRILDLLNAKEKEKEKAREREKAAKGDGSISDILAAFPSPSPTTATAQRPPGWPTPSPHGKSALSRAQTPGYGSSVSQRQRRRKCCGLPVWAFVLLIIILLLLIAAAVVIPITLVVIPREHKDSSPSLASCRTSFSCANGGSSIVVKSQCRCICANGFTGSSCNTAADAGCTATDIPGANASITYPNATLGESIPRIFSASSTNFSIPLAPYAVLSLFSTFNLSCASENALVTFNQKSQRRDIAQVLLPDSELHQEPTLVPLGELLSSPTKTYNHVSRILHARGSAITTNGILVAAPSSSDAGGSPAPESSATSVSSPTTTTNERPITQRVLDFSRTAVLFIFQETSSLDEAMAAANKLQMTLSGGKTFDASQLSVSVNVTVDLSAFTVFLGNGTHYGGKGAS